MRCRGALLGSAAVLVWNDVAAAGREQFYQWHDKEHIPERLAISGFRRGRRYIKPGHSPEWLTFYEADDLDVLVSPAYLARLDAPTPATTSTLKYFRNTSRAVCRVAHTLGTSSGGHVLAMRLEVSAAHRDAVVHELVANLFPDIASLVGVLSCHLFNADQPSSLLNTAESSTRAFDVPAWVLLVEASSADAALQAHRQIEAADLRGIGVSVRSDWAVYALEICRLAQPAQLN
jgi:hypothetical protein